MKFDVFNIDDFIKANKCQQVTSPVFFQYDGNPTPDGLFSYDIFGMSDEDRMNRFGYIDLHDHFLHPLVYSIMSTRMGVVKDILNCEKYAVVAGDDIRIVPEDTEGAMTGTDFFFENFEKINWTKEIEDRDVDSIDKTARLKFLKSLKKNEFFVTKWLVLPPYYRDQSSTDRSMGDDINKLYKELISKSGSLSSGFSFNLFGNETRMRIQALLQNIYYMTLTPVSGKHVILDKTGGSKLVGSGKNSTFRRHLLGKTLDWTASSVITSPQNNKAWNGANKPVPFGYTRVPLGHCLSIFQPYFVYGVSLFLNNALETFRAIHANEIKRINTGQFSTSEIEKLIVRYIKAPGDRFDPVEFSYTDINGKATKAHFLLDEYSLQDIKTKTVTETRPMTLTDLFYMVALDVLRDKHVYVTRYPIASFQSIFPARVAVASTEDTREVYIARHNEKPVLYYEYPYIKGYGKSNNINTKFYDVYVMGNEYIAPLGADYDGDVVFIKSIFSKEANAETDRLIFSKKNFFSASGELIRSLKSIGKDCILGLYEFTKEDPTKNKA